MGFDATSDDEFENLPPGEVVVKLSGERKNKIKASWASALIVKAFGKSVGFHFLHSRLTSMWKPSRKMDCIDLGSGFFLIKFTLKEDHARVLKGGPWLMGGHYLSIRGWEQNFRPEDANLSSVVVWVRLPGLLIEYYELLVLRDIGKAIGPILRIDTHTASETKGRFMRLYVQVNFDDPLVKLVKVGGIDQPVQYEGISSLCFSCGRVGHKAEGCPYTTRSMEKVFMVDNEAKGPASHETWEKVEPDSSAFGPWVLVARNRKQARHAGKVFKPDANSGIPSQSPTKPNRPFSLPSHPLCSDVDQKAEDTRYSDVSGSSAICADRTNAKPSGYTPKLSHITFKGMKPKSNPKGKKSIAHSRKKSLPEWKMIKSLDSETTKLKSLQARFGFSGENIEIKEFKARGSVESESGCLNHESKRLSVELKKVAVMEDADMIMVSSFGLATNGNSNNNLSHQEDRPPLMEQPPNQHEEGYNQMSSMDFEVRSIA